LPASETTAVRVALSNDYELVLRGLAGLLAPYAERVRVVGISTDPDFEEEVDLVLFDAFGRLAPGDEKLRRVVADNPAARVVVYSWDTYPPDVARAAGAVGWIHKGVEPEELVDLLERAHRGESIEAHPDAVPDLYDEGMTDWPGRSAGLSAREAEVLSFICQGLENTEIAERCFLSINTVKTYIRTAYRKIGVSRRSQAIVWAIDHGLGESGWRP